MLVLGMLGFVMRIDTIPKFTLFPFIVFIMGPFILEDSRSYACCCCCCCWAIMPFLFISQPCYVMWQVLNIQSHVIRQLGSFTRTFRRNYQTMGDTSLQFSTVLTMVTYFIIYNNYYWQLILIISKLIQLQFKFYIEDFYV